MSTKRKPHPSCELTEPKIEHKIGNVTSLAISFHSVLTVHLEGHQWAFRFLPACRLVSSSTVTLGARQGRTWEIPPINKSWNQGKGSFCFQISSDVDSNVSDVSHISICFTFSREFRNILLESSESICTIWVLENSGRYHSGGHLESLRSVRSGCFPDVYYSRTASLTWKKKLVGKTDLHSLCLSRNTLWSPSWTKD